MKDLETKLCHDHRKLRGEKILVQIYENKFGKRKYNRGHAVGGVLILGGLN